MLVVELNKENYEYDVNSLVKAFYPQEQVKILIPESREETRAMLREHKELLLNGTDQCPRAARGEIRPSHRLGKQGIPRRHIWGVDALRDAVNAAAEADGLEPVKVYAGEGEA